LTSDGKLYAWGWGTSGQLGHGSSPTYQATPVAVNMTGVLAGKTVTAIAAGNTHSLALTSDGRVFAWGGGTPNYGHLGNNAWTNSSVPVPVDVSGVLAGKTVTQIVAYGEFSMALTSDGNVFGWGYNNFGQLGDNSNTNRNVPVAVNTSGVLSGKVVSYIAVGNNFTQMLTSDGQVFACGVGTTGQLGNGLSTNSNVPVAVNMSGMMAGKTVSKIASGANTTLALTSDGQLFAWGINTSGQFGDGTLSNSAEPVQVTQAGAFAGKTIADIAPAGLYTIVLTTDGKLIGWGGNAYGQLARGDFMSTWVPTLLNAPAGQTVSKIATGNASHVLLLSASGEPMPPAITRTASLATGPCPTTTRLRTCLPRLLAAKPLEPSVAVSAIPWC